MVFVFTMMGLTGEARMVNVMTIVQTNSPAPNRAPMLYATPSAPPDATMAVTTSPAPLARAMRVTPARASLILKR